MDSYSQLMTLQHHVDQLQSKTTANQINKQEEEE